MAEAVAYEEQRRRQVEANKRKLEELLLHHLSAAVREAAAKPGAEGSAAAAEPLRRSSRVANLPKKPDYRLGRKDLPDRGSATDEERRHAITKAQELAEKRDSRFPNFVKSITKYYASGGSVALPTAFCQEHLPERDERITLEDEEGHKYSTTYLPGNLCLSAGWRRFANQHKLVDVDCLVFQLIKTTKFKIYIKRASSYYEKMRSDETSTF